jgi:hypothetical protein
MEHTLEPSQHHRISLEVFWQLIVDVSRLELKLVGVELGSEKKKMQATCYL